MRLAPCLDSTISFLPLQLKVAPCGLLDIICLPLKNCGCSSVVERLVANEKVASSTLVTRSSPESFRGWSECAGAWRRRTAQKHQLRLAGQPPDALRLRAEVAV
jgi:hypothetical protein